MSQNLKQINKGINPRLVEVRKKVRFPDRGSKRQSCRGFASRRDPQRLRKKERAIAGVCPAASSLVGFEGGVVRKEAISKGAKGDERSLSYFKEVKGAQGVAKVGATSRGARSASPKRTQRKVGGHHSQESRYIGGGRVKINTTDSFCQK